jgi:hypothetical protein
MISEADSLVNSESSTRVEKFIATFADDFFNFYEQASQNRGPEPTFLLKKHYIFDENLVTAQQWCSQWLQIGQQSPLHSHHAWGNKTTSNNCRTLSSDIEVN